MARKIINRGTKDNPQTGDSLYVGAEKINDNFEELYNSGGGISEAPIDGKQYARKDADWSEVEATSSGDMEKVTYDPNLKESDAFDMTNMVEGVNANILTDAERLDIGNNKTNISTNASDIATNYNDITINADNIQDLDNDFSALEVEFASVKSDVEINNQKTSGTFQMDLMSNMTESKETPIDADNLTLWDSVVGKFKQFSILHLINYIATIFAVLDRRVDMGSGSVLDFSLGNTFKRNTLTDLGGTDFTMINLPDSDKVGLATFYLTGEAPWNLIGATKLLGEYNGTVINQIAIEVVNGNPGFEEIYYSITPLTV